MSSVINKPWKIVNPPELDVEDMSIFTDDNIEVIGCSEWMRAEDETFSHIVNLHNEWLKK